MARTGFFHHIGSFLLFASTILLLVTTISSPVVDNIALLKVTLSNATSTHNSAITFGTFGFCTIHTASGHDACSAKTVGYSPAAVVSLVDGTDTFSTSTVDATRSLTKVMVLHPVATGIAFLAFLLAVGSGVIGSFLGSLVSLIAFVVTVVVLITDFVLFHTIKNHVNKDGSGSKAAYGVAIWTLLAAAIASLLGTVVVFFSCCSARLHEGRTSKVEPGYAAGPRRRRWF